MNFQRRENPNLVCQILSLCFAEKIYEINTHSLGPPIVWEHKFLEGRTPTTSEVATFLIVVLSSFHIRSLVETRSLENFFMNSWKACLLTFFFKWMNLMVFFMLNHIKHKEILSVGQTPPSILNGVVRWHLTNLWQTTLQLYAIIDLDEWTKTWPKSLHLWGSSKHLEYNIVSRFRITHKYTSH